MSSFTNPIASFGENVFTPDGLVLSLDDVVSRKVTILTGQNLARGTVLGKITATGKYKASAAANGDGSETPDCILVEATDATGGDAEAMGYFRGRFSSGALTIGAGLTVAGITEGLRGKGIDLISVMA
jgi:hypothetical protein